MTHPLRTFSSWISSVVLEPAPSERVARRSVGQLGRRRGEVAAVARTAEVDVGAARAVDLADRRILRADADALAHAVGNVLELLHEDLLEWDRYSSSFGEDEAALNARLIKPSILPKINATPRKWGCVESESQKKNI